ncbi:unnamed protein product [Clonostachys byssicola]|uniref:Uncharacterized protein n=1 Tax=Clonostachys byssicola TaxID=160290 RepID=A0A9N9UZ80_9HYPO|nr:unnamed protein product [Clonostachys byssicola]
MVGRLRARKVDRLKVLIVGGLKARRVDSLRAKIVEGLRARIDDRFRAGMIDSLEASGLVSRGSRWPQLECSRPPRYLNHWDRQFRDMFTTTESKYSVMPTDPASFLQWLVGTNPILARLLDLAEQIVMKKSEKILVYADTPWLQSCGVL